MHIIGQDSKLLTQQELPVAKKLMAFVRDHKNLQEVTEMIDQSHYYIERNANPKILMLNLSIRLGRIFRQKSIILG